MKSVNSFVLNVLFISSSVLHLQVKSQNITDGVSSLKLLQVLFRHGDRTPLDKGENFLNASDWPQGYGQLTNQGKQHEYELGELLRSLYSDYINFEYVPGQMYMRSTDEDRTLESAELVLAGLYPPQGNEVWNSKMPWQPIPVHTIPKDLDYLFSKVNCPAYDEEFAEVLQLPQVLAFNERFSNLYIYLQNNSGVAIIEPSNVRGLYTTLKIMVENNITLPTWAPSVFPYPMIVPAIYSDILPTYTLPMQQVMAGPFLSEVLTRFQTAETLSEQLFLYSGHDTNIAAILHSLEIFRPPHLPHFSSALIFEMHQENEVEPYIMIWYREDSRDSDPRLLTLPSCKSKCPLSQFASILQPLIPVEFVRMCVAEQDITNKTNHISNQNNNQ